MNKYIPFILIFISVYCYAQQQDYVDFEKLDATVYIFSDSSEVFTRGVYEFKVLDKTDSVFIDARKMKFSGVRLKNKKDNYYYSENEFDYHNTGEKIWLKHDFEAGERYLLSFESSSKPKAALYFLRKSKNPHIWTQGQGKYTSRWLPSFDDVNEKVVFNLSLVFKPDYVAITNGEFLGSNPLLGTKEILYNYSMVKPMSSYLVALTIGKYDHQTVYAESGIPLELYYYPEDSLKYEPTYRYTKGIFDFYENELDYPYPWGVYRQVPVHDFLYAGMENTSLTIFSDAFVVDSIGYNDKNYINVNAHEMAHQWFGDLVTAKSGAHHWLQEGFATYYALLAEKKIFGDDYYAFELYQSAQQLGRQDDSGNGTSLLDPKSSSLTFYQRGAWVLHALRSQIGNAAFRRAVNTYLKTYEFSSAETDDFIKIVEAQTGEDLSDFKELWIVQKRFPFEAAIALLRQQSEFLVEYMMVNCEANSSKCNEYLKYGRSDEAKIKVISQQPGLITKNTFQNSLKVRRAIAQYLTKIPDNLKFEFETLLDDPSYLTIEGALYNLWVNFPSDRSRYLSKTRNVQGLSNKNVRLLWLVLHLNTPEFQSDTKELVYKELVGYTNPEYSAEIRMSAFEYLSLLKACNAKCQLNIEEAKTHHNWRLVKFAKETQME